MCACLLPTGAPAASYAGSDVLTFTQSSAWDIDAQLRALDAAQYHGVDTHASHPSAWSSTGDTASAHAEGALFESAAIACGSHASSGPAPLSGQGPSMSMFTGARAVHMSHLAMESFARHIPDVIPPDDPHRVDVRPSSAFIERGLVGPSSCVRDQHGTVIMWPWDKPNDAFSGGYQPLPKQQRLPHRTDDLRNRAMDASMASGDMGRGSTGVRHWRAFCELEGTPHDRPIDPSSPLWVKLEEELLAMQFCCALVTDRGVQASTAACYFGQVQGWHAKEHGIKLAAGIKLARLPAMLKGMRRILGESGRAIRRGIAPQALRAAMDLVLDPCVPAHANIRAALAVALQGLLRSAEYACDSGVKFQSSKHLTRGDIAECSADRLVLMMLPCKNMRHLTGKTCPLVIGAGGEYVDAVHEVRNMLAVDPVDRSLASVTPLFRDPVSNEPLRTNHLRDLIRRLMGAVGEPDPSQFGTHSLRIGGATALFAAGADETVIRTMGRWSSDCYRLYVRACYESTLKWSRLAGSTQVRDLAGEFDEVDYY